MSDNNDMMLQKGEDEGLVGAVQVDTDISEDVCGYTGIINEGTRCSCREHTGTVEFGCSNNRTVQHYRRSG